MTRSNQPPQTRGRSTLLSPFLALQCFDSYGRTGIESRPTRQRSGSLTAHVVTSSQECHVKTCVMRVMVEEVDPGSVWDSRSRTDRCHVSNIVSEILLLWKMSDEVMHMSCVLLFSRSPSFPLIQDTVLKGKLSVPELRVTRLMNRSISCTMKNPKGELFSYPPNSQVSSRLSSSAMLLSQLGTIDFNLSN